MMNNYKTTRKEGRKQARKELLVVVVTQ